MSKISSTQWRKNMKALKEKSQREIEENFECYDIEPITDNILFVCYH